jgi:hypothetical protein
MLPPIAAAMSPPNAPETVAAEKKTAARSPNSLLLYQHLQSSQFQDLRYAEEREGVREVVIDSREETCSPHCISTSQSSARTDQRQELTSFCESEHESGSHETIVVVGETLRDHADTTGDHDARKPD